MQTSQSPLHLSNMSQVFPPEEPAQSHLLIILSLTEEMCRNILSVPNPPNLSKLHGWWQLLFSWKSDSIKHHRTATQKVTAGVAAGRAWTGTASRVKRLQNHLKVLLRLWVMRQRHDLLLESPEDCWDKYLTRRCAWRWAAGSDQATRLLLLNWDRT